MRFWIEDAKENEGTTVCLSQNLSFPSGVAIFAVDYELTNMTIAFVVLIGVRRGNGI